MTDENVPEARPNESPRESTCQSLLDRARTSDQEAWAQLVELYAPLVYLRCRQQWELPPADAENVGQDVFASVARKIGDFDRKRTGSFRAWLRTIVNNKCIDYLRKNSPGSGQGGSSIQTKLANVPGPESAIDEPIGPENEKSVIMRQAMKAVENEFSSRDWKLFWDVMVEDRNRKDIAEQNSVSSNVVYLACSRIKKRIKEIYDDLIDDDLLKPLEPPSRDPNSDLPRNQ